MREGVPWIRVGLRRGISARGVETRRVITRGAKARRVILVIRGLVVTPRGRVGHGISDWVYAIVVAVAVAVLAISRLIPLSVQFLPLSDDLCSRECFSIRVVRLRSQL